MDGETDDDQRQNERQGLLKRLLDAVKQCQIRFGGRSELATDSDSRVSCLCATWEAALQHGMRKNKVLSALRQVTEIAGLGKVSDFLSEVKHLDSEPAFWFYVREHLTRHEIQRFNSLKQINTDMGRGRAWLRASLNEHSLERYMHMLIERNDIIKQYYHDWAFMCDQERNSMLPTMSAGLGSILFAIVIDRPELCKPYHSTLQAGSRGEILVPGTTDDEPRPIIVETSSVVQKKEKKKKKKLAYVVNFDEGNIAQPRPQRQNSTSSFKNSNKADRSSSYSLHPSDSSDAPLSVQDVASAEMRLLGTAQQPTEIYSTSSIEPHSSMNLASTVFDPQLSLASASSVLSSESHDGMCSVSKSGTASIASTDGDISSAVLMPVGDREVSGDIVPKRHNYFFSSDVVHSDASSEMSVHSNSDVDSAALALAVAQRGFQRIRSEGDGSTSVTSSEKSHQQMSHDELRQAVVAMMVRKDEIELQNRSLQSLLEQEMETSSMLRAEIADLKQSHAVRQENDKGLIDTLQSENEILKHQLKKYVNAVQLLRSEGATNSDDGLGTHVGDIQPSLPPPKPAVDYSQEMSDYEQKLIQVAEMHGELMEFNEQLHRQLCAKDNILKQLKQELINLRGPLPYDERGMEESISASVDSRSMQVKTLINIWIPSAFLWGSAPDQYHVYQVYLRIKDEEWNVFRRFNQFWDFHSRIKKVYPVVSKLEFPAKKSVGSKDVKVVEARRQIFQVYLRHVINLLLEKNPDLSSNACKSRLVTILPFFGDEASVSNTKGKKKGQQQSPHPPPSSSPSSGRRTGDPGRTQRP